MTCKITLFRLSVKIQSGRLNKKARSIFVPFYYAKSMVCRRSACRIVRSTHDGVAGCAHTLCIGSDIDVLSVLHVQVDRPVVAELHDFIALAVAYHIPALLLLVETEFHGSAFTFFLDGVTVLGSGHQELAVLGIHLFHRTCGNRVRTTPELNGVQHKNVCQESNLIDRDNPQSDVDCGSARSGTCCR